MTFKDLKNKLSKVQVFSNNKKNNQLDNFISKLFWIWNKQDNTIDINKRQSLRNHYSRNTGEVDFRELDPGAAKKV